MTQTLNDLVVNLPAGITHRASTSEDTPAITQVIRQLDVYCCGETSSTESEVAGDLSNPAVSVRGGAICCFDNQNLVASLIAHNQIDDKRGLFADIFADPNFNAELMEEICNSLLSASEEFVAQSLKSHSFKDDYVKTGIYAQDVPLRNALEKRGYEQHRIYWRMRKDLSEFELPKLSGEFQLIDYDGSDEMMHRIYELQTDVFQDHYDFHPLSFENWVNELTEGVNDLGQWHLIEHENQLVGFTFGSNRFADEGFGYVASLGVKREFRGLGLAKALLNKSFQRDLLIGHSSTILHCDSTNPNGAVQLYESVGMRPDRNYLAYRKLVAVKP